MRVRCDSVRSRSESNNPTLQRFTLRQLEEQVSALRDGVGVRALVLAELDAALNQDDWESSNLQAQLCERLGLRPWTLASSLREANTTFAALLTEARYRRAIELLDARKENIATISGFLRFSSQGAFTRFFHKKSGMTPTDYRKQRRASILAPSAGDSESGHRAQD